MTGCVLPVPALMRQRTDKIRVTTPRVRTKRTVFSALDGEVIE